MTDISKLSKAELCKALGWSKPKLDRRLASDKNFPVRKRGNQSGGWEFDLPIVMRYLQISADAAPKPGRPPAKVVQTDSRPAVQLPAAPAAVQHAGEATARQRREFAQARILEDKLARERGELMDTESVRSTISTMLGRFGKALDNLPDQIIKRLGLDDARLNDIRQVIDDMRQAMVADLKALLAAEEPPATK